MDPVATILIPTTGNRAPLLRYSLGSVLQQTEKNIEIFIIGDGVAEESRREIVEMSRADARIRYFDHPKSGRRGELNRDRALRHEGRGRIITYLCDRDLYLPDHIETLSGILERFDFAAMNFMKPPLPDRPRDLTSAPFFGASSPGENRHRVPMFPLSTVGHTREMYLKLPHGWRETPGKIYTELYMWQQFFAHPECRVFSSPRVTLLYFKRGNHPGWPVERRLPELRGYFETIQDPEKLRLLREDYDIELARQNMARKKALFLVRGFTPGQLPGAVKRRIARFLKPAGEP
jgi:glycosyltransferase involved in cell wall biosynthesis